MLYRNAECQKAPVARWIALQTSDLEIEPAWGNHEEGVNILLRVIRHNQTDWIQNHTVPGSNNALPSKVEPATFESLKSWLNFFCLGEIWGTKREASQETRASPSGVAKRRPFACYAPDEKQMRKL